MYLAPIRLVRTDAVRAVPRPAARPRANAASEPLIGQVLVERGALSPGDLVRALALHGRQDVRLGEILLTHNMISEAELYAALADQWNARLVDLVAQPPDPRLIDSVGTEICLKHQFVPWRRVGGATVIVTARPEEFARRAEELPASMRPALMAVASERDVLAALLAQRSRKLVRRAETRVAEEESCRVWDGGRFQRLAIGVLSLLLAGLIAAPIAAFAALTALGLLVLAANTGIRIAALWLRAKDRLDRTEKTVEKRAPSIARLPVVSILVPLYHERAIAERLVLRLSRLSYPRELLDICLVTEDNDETTRATLAKTKLPRWLRVVTVPEGTLRTKPRALNYALDFCRGSIIGVYDAEDAPAADQIHKVVARFHERGPKVACLQGILDYYNARSNWMARCFALEYASWFRVILPGLQRMGFAIPLGGTTLFFRRSALEELGGWDAHNVTEDADLGIRLARHGYRAELIDTVTEEEANCRPWPWVKQRSRWIKGYAMTWAVHMRAPRQLLRDLGPRKFVGVQLLFGASLAQVFLAPVLWSYWLVLVGLPHPVGAAMPGWAATTMAVAFAVAFAVNIAVMVVGVSGPKHRHLIPWSVTLDAYFPLATIAACKAFIEMVAKPFYWDKTCHGIDDEAADAAWHEKHGDIVLPTPPIRVPAQRPALADPIGAEIISQPTPQRQRHHA